MLRAVTILKVYGVDKQIQYWICIQQNVIKPQQLE